MSMSLHSPAPSDRSSGAPQRAVLAIDYGRRRLGLAVSDPLGITARPPATWEGPHPPAARPPTQPRPAFCATTLRAAAGRSRLAPVGRSRLARLARSRIDMRRL